MNLYLTTLLNLFQFSSVQPLSRVWLFAAPWTAACLASLSITNSWSLLKLTSMELVIEFFTSSNKSLVETSGIFLLEYHIICKLWHVYFFSSSLDVFYFFSCYWARTSNIVLSRRDNSGFPWLVPDFRGKAFSFSPLSLMLLVSLVYMAFIVFKHVPFMPSLTEKKFYTSFLVSSSSDIFFLIVESDWK